MDWWERNKESIFSFTPSLLMMKSNNTEDHIELFSKLELDWLFYLQVQVISLKPPDNYTPLSARLVIRPLFSCCYVVVSDLPLYCYCRFWLSYLTLVYKREYSRSRTAHFCVFSGPQDNCKTQLVMKSFTRLTLEAHRVIWLLLVELYNFYNIMF